MTYQSCLRLLLATAVALTSSVLFAAPAVDTMALKNYATRVLPRCANAAITLEPINRPAPSGFMIFQLTQKSTEKHCGTQKVMLYAPNSRQIIIGTAFALPADGRPANARVADAASQILNTRMTATVSPFPLPDGLKSVSMTKQTQFGPFSYRGFLDASEQFLMVGSRGTLGSDPVKVLRDTLGLQNAVRRGNKAGKVEIIELSDFQCPTCAHAHEKVEPLVKANLNKIDYYRLDLPLFEHHAWALQAALGARAIQKAAPTKYWTYVDYVFKNQETIEKSGNFDKFFRDFVGDHDINWKAVEATYLSQSERQAVLDQVSRAFDVGVNSTPTYLINGEIVNFGDGAYTMGLLRSAIAKAGTPAPAKPAAASKKKSK